MSQSIIIGWPNRAPQSTLTGGAWAGALPLTNLASREPWRVARSTNATQAATQFDVDMGKLHSLRCFALGNHNLSLAGKWRIQIGTAAGLADVYDSAWQAAWALSFDADLLEWESLTYWEGVVDDPAAYAGYPYPALYVLPTWANGRYVRILIDDEGNPAGYVQIGQLFVGGGLQPTYSASYGLKDSWKDRTQITESESGYAFADPRRRRRAVQFATEHLSLTESAAVHELQRRQGVWGEVLWVPYPHSQQESQRYGFIGRLSELSAIDYPYYRSRSTGWSITEI